MKWPVLPRKSVETVFTIARLEDDPYRKLALEQVLREEAAGANLCKRPNSRMRKNISVTSGSLYSGKLVEALLSG